MRIVTVFVISLLSLSRTNAKETLHLGMLFSQRGVFDFSGLIPAIEIALETIDDEETLPFNFTYTHSDSMVSYDLIVHVVIIEVSHLCQ